MRRLTSPPHRQSVAQISGELGIHVASFYQWRKTWQLQGEVVPASEKNPNGWCTHEKFTVVPHTAGLNAIDSVAAAGSKGYFLSSWSAGGRPPRMSTPSHCSL